ncbi:MAG: hypothetical protein IJ249_06320 [Paludibacteraceae bacterium]|nr:hypothetical protein [Paludibacteraceae bacterium]
MKKYQIPQITMEHLYGAMNLMTLSDNGDTDMGKMGNSATGGINNPDMAPSRRVF